MIRMMKAMRIRSAAHVARIEAKEEEQKKKKERDH
jgi:hypothetical protein